MLTRTATKNWWNLLRFIANLCFTYATVFTVVYMWHGLTPADNAIVIIAGCFCKAAMSLVVKKKKFRKFVSDRYIPVLLIGIVLDGFTELLLPINPMAKYLFDVLIGCTYIQLYETVVYETSLLLVDTNDERVEWRLVQQFANNIGCGIGGILGLVIVLPDVYWAAWVGMIAVSITYITTLIRVYLAHKCIRDNNIKPKKF